MGKSYLVTGGSRSGKSRYALELAKSAKKPYYIATGWPGDDEMRGRIEKHKKEREERWKTMEIRVEISDAILKARKQGADFIVVDCLTLWVSNLLLENRNIDQEVKKLLLVIKKVSKTPLVFVTNEVGSGIVPENKISREFRDAAGFVNQRIASAVDNVILMICGIPLQILKSGISRL